MGLEATSWLRTARVIVVEVEGEQIGLLVDGITKVRRIENSDLDKNPSLREGHQTDHILCVARPEPDELVVIIDLDAILGETLA